MNPIMLKIRPGMRSEVSMLGENFGEMAGRDYREHFLNKHFNQFAFLLNNLLKSMKQL